MLTRTQRILNVSAILLTLPAALAAKDAEVVGVRDLGRAQYNWVLHCQGCHAADAAGTPGGAPRMAGEVARFLKIKEGRAFLGRVPGVAFVELPDRDVADLLNWLVQRFDSAHVPKTFVPYTEEEIKTLRRDPLISNAYSKRQRLVQELTKLRVIEK
jgi:mono/diheme cytochrome c family protein